MLATRLGIIAMAFMVVACGCVASEFRGAWVTAWNPGFFTPEEIDNTVAAAKRAKLTALFIQVRKNGDAYYCSSTEPRGNGIADGFDPLACVIEKAHAQGIQVHAWVNTLRMWASKTPPTDPNHIVNRHPEWINRDNTGATRASEGLYLDPGIPEAREYIASVLEEIARRYDVDGIHLDYIRYPGKTWGYSQSAQMYYCIQAGSSAKPQPGDPGWLQWRRDQVTELVKLVRAKVNAARPGAILTASTIAWGGCHDDFCDTSPYANLCQDWKKWLEDGLIDASCPMNYKDEGSAKQAQSFRDWLCGFGRWSGGKPTYVGIEVHVNQVPQTLRQIEAVRKAKLDGFMLFSFNQSQRRTALVNALSTFSRTAKASD